jgi:hypothetical protein
VLPLANKAIKFLFSKELPAEHRSSPECFTRNRLMGFAKIMGVILNFPKKSLQLEVNGFMKLLDPAIEKPMTKQAFSKARHNILPSAFKELFESGVETVFEEDLISRHKGWRVFAIDGTELQLPSHGDNLPGFRHNSEHSLPHARASILCDVITGFIIHAAMDTTAKSERSMAMEHLEFFKPFKRGNDLIVFDRGYPSKELIKHLSDNGFKYLMRVPKGFCHAADASPECDFKVQILGCDARSVKVVLPSGETELLFTNLGEDEFKTGEFMELYHLRWGIEVKYNFLKNKLDIESFSGRTLLTVLQDFYATMFLSNMANGFRLDANEAIREGNAGKELKHDEYAANENLMIGGLKDNLIMILFEEDGTKRVLLFQKLLERISRHYVPVIPGRSFPRRPDSHKRIANKPRKAL